MNVHDTIKAAETATIGAHAIADVWKEPSDIPPRQWIYDKHYIRRFISSTVAPGGAGKSTLALGEAIVMASGLSLIGPACARKHRVWYWNGEDPLEETQRRVAAFCKHHGVKLDDVRGHLFLSSGREAESQIRIAYEDEKRNFRLDAACVAQIENFIRLNKIDVVIVDPFVRTHGVSENDNQKMNAVVEEFARLAERTNCAIELIHHVRKPSGEGEYTVLDGRGASAVHAAARSMRVLNFMTDDEAKRAQLRSKQRRFYFRVDNGKSNMAAPPEVASWYHIVGVDLGNHAGDWPNDNVGVVTTFVWPDPQEVPSDKILEIQQTLAVTDYKASPQAVDWAGRVIAKAMGIRLDSGDEDERGMAKRQVLDLIKLWTERRYLKKVDKKDPETRKMRPILVPDVWVYDEAAPM